MKPRDSTRSPLLEATWSGIAWAIVGPTWYALDSLRAWGKLMPYEIAIGMVPWLVGAIIVASILRFASSVFSDSRATYVWVDVLSLLVLAGLLTLLTGWDPIDPNGTLVYTAMWMVLTGLPLVLCSALLSMGFSILWERHTLKSRSRSIPDS